MTHKDLPTVSEFDADEYRAIVDDLSRSIVTLIEPDSHESAQDAWVACYNASHEVLMSYPLFSGHYPALYGLIVEHGDGHANWQSAVSQCSSMRKALRCMAYARLRHDVLKQIEASDPFANYNFDVELPEEFAPSQRAEAETPEQEA